MHVRCIYLCSVTERNSKTIDVNFRQRVGPSLPVAHSLSLECAVSRSYVEEKLSSVGRLKMGIKPKILNFAFV